MDGVVVEVAEGGLHGVQRFNQRMAGKPVLAHGAVHDLPAFVVAGQRRGCESGHDSLQNCRCGRRRLGDPPTRSCLILLYVSGPQTSVTFITGREQCGHHVGRRSVDSRTHSPCETIPMLHGNPCGRTSNSLNPGENLLNVNGIQGWRTAWGPAIGVQDDIAEAAFRGRNYGLPLT